MELKVKDVAKILRLSEKTIYRMVQNEAIPCAKVGGQWRFNKGEILAWVDDAKEFTSSEDWEANFTVNNKELTSLPELLRRGGLYYRIGGTDKEEVIRESITLIKTGYPQETISKLVESTMEREKLCSTAIGHGIALPHPRTLKGFTSEISSISLCFLENPVSFGALDREDVKILFFISPRNEVRYLKLQAKLLAFLRQKNVLSILKNVPSRKEIYELFSLEKLSKS